jgi:hypothetical protein
MACNDPYTPYVYTSRSSHLSLVSSSLSHLPLTPPILRLNEIRKRLRLLVSMPVCKHSQLHAQSPPPSSIPSCPSPTILPHIASPYGPSPTPPIGSFYSPSRYPNSLSKTQCKEIAKHTVMRMRVIRRPNIFHLIYTAALRTALDRAAA